MTASKSITILFPHRGIGGAQVLFARVAEYLCADSDLQVTIIDHRDGYIAQYLSNRICGFQLVPWGETDRVSLPAQSICLAPLSYWHWFGRAVKASDNGRVFLWDIHPFNLVESTAFSGWYKNLSVEHAALVMSFLEKGRRDSLRRFIESGVEHQGIAFMCSKNLEYNQKLFAIKSLKANYLPIPISSTESRLFPLMPRHKSPDRFDIAWLSRLDAGKARVLFGLLEDIARYHERNRDSHLVMHVIGIGYESSAIERKARSMSIEIHMAGLLQGFELDEYIQAVGIDIAFSMGTSALEFAVRGIPTVLTPGSVLDDIYCPAKPKYRWLFDSEGYNLSSEPCDASKDPLKKFDDIIGDLRKPDAFLTFGRLCRMYAIENHGLTSVMNRLMGYLDNNSFTLSEMRRTGVFSTSTYERILLSAKDAYKKLLRRSYPADAFVGTRPS